jgi:hypothetical protein
MILEHIPEQYKNNFHVVRAAVSQNGLALQFASERLRNNKDIVLRAVKEDYRAFFRASSSLQQDRDVIVTSLKTKPRKDFTGLSYSILYHALPVHILKMDRSITLLFVSEFPIGYFHLLPEFYKDKEILVAALKSIDIDFWDNPKRSKRHFAEMQDTKKQMVTKASPELQKDHYIKWLVLDRASRKKFVRERIIRGVLESARLLRKYHPEGVWFKKWMEHDQDFH